MSLKEDIEGMRNLREQAENLYKKSNQELEKLKGRIANGERSGDDILDFSIAYTEEVEDSIRSLDSRLKGKTGELVLVAYEKKKASRDMEYTEGGIIPPHISYDIELRLKAGILTGGLGLDIGKREITIPTIKCVFASNRYDDNFGNKFFNMKYELVDGPISSKPLEVLDLEGLMTSGLGRILDNITDIPIITSRVFVGKEVDDYFTEEGTISDAYCNIVDMLNKGS